MEKKGLL